ncbi:InlB B-repeat-containing protein [Gudongella oleilytica]|uniref:InlB B-repeat-containing protein n=1 Tax=Gudongella oleilytica TaxID=1582259 RepID=UPI002A36B5DC|nr:InlB B-repeat-containing protein [Gudongella oleilytica]MDY0255732.1 InlB B-repeat-containing protein [Gudongella oleilytica]
MKNNRQGMTLIEVILAITLLSILSISMISGFSSQFMNINRGTDITIAAMDGQSEFEDLMYDVRSKIQDYDPSDSWDDLVATVPEWDVETVEVLGNSFEMQKLTKDYSDGIKENTIYLSSKLAEVEKRAKIPISGVRIGVSTDANGLMADLSLSPLPVLTAEHDDNSSFSGFYVNLYRWWKSVPGKDLASLQFPEDFILINVSQTTDELTDLLDNAGAGRYVALTVTPVDIHGYRGNTAISSNFVFIKGAEWRIGAFPWADTNNNYNLEGSDVRIATERLQEILEASIHTIPNFIDPTEMLSIENSSLFVPMNTEPGGGQIPGEIPIQINGSEIIDWTFENNINLSKDILVTNGSDTSIIAGTGGSGGSIYFYPYIELDLLGNPVTVNGVPNLIDYGASIVSNGDITLKTMSNGDIELFNNNQLEGTIINLEARGSIIINNSTLISDGDITVDTMKNPEISGNRLIRFNSAVLTSTSPDSMIDLRTRSDIVFKGGGWSSNQILVVPDEAKILFTSGNSKVNNAGIVNLNNVARMYFEHSMSEDLQRSLRIRLEKNTNDEFLLTTINYNRNVAYASPSSNQTVILPGLWTKLGTGAHNFEFSTRVLSGPGSVNDLAYSYDGNGVIGIDVISTSETANTRVKFDVRDRFNPEITGTGYFNFEIDASGVHTIEVEEPPPLDYYTITFNTNGGTAVAPVGGYVGESVGSITNPTRIGYVFLGWDDVLPLTIPDHDLELNALWEPILYTITLNSNGGSPVSSISLMYDEQVAIPDPTRIGYTFVGWNPAPPERMPAEDLNFTAQWTQNTLTINFDANGGTTPSFTSKQVLYDSQYGELPTTSRDGYIFSGWYTSASGGTLVNENTIVSIPNNHTLYARWASSHGPLQWLSINPTGNRNTFTLTFNNNLQGPIVSTDLGNSSNYNVTDKTLTFNRSNTNEGNYYVRVRDMYGQQLRVNLSLNRVYIWIFAIGWEWSVTGTAP